MKRFKTYLKEVSYKDYYHANFQIFRKKYLSQANKGLLNDHYVNFTNHQSDLLDRTANPTPDHSDPVGTYGYPIKYVLKNPADVWYGANAKYLRVLKHVKKDKTLYLQDIGETNTIQHIRDMYNITIGEANEIYSQTYKWLKKWGNSNIIIDGMILFFNVQHDMSAEPEFGGPSSWSPTKPKYPARSSKEQTDLLLKMGYLTVVDQAKNNKWAVINDREPEQILFLRRDAFEVVEIYNMNQKSEYVQTTTDPEKIERKLVAELAKMMDGDKLADGPERSSLGGWSYYWTKKGRRIEIEFDLSKEYWEYKMNSRKMGEKKHKEMKLHDMKEPSIKIRSEYGMISWTYEPKTTFDEIIKDLKEDWETMKKKPMTRPYLGDVWEPENRKEFLQKQDKARSLSIIKRLLDDFYPESKNIKHLEDTFGYPIKTLKDYAEHLKKMSPEIEKEIEKIYQNMEK